MDTGSILRSRTGPGRALTSLASPTAFSRCGAILPRSCGYGDKTRTTGEVCWPWPRTESGDWPTSGGGLPQVRVTLTMTSRLTRSNKSTPLTLTHTWKRQAALHWIAVLPLLQSCSLSTGLHTCCPPRFFVAALKTRTIAFDCFALPGTSASSRR